MPTTGDVPQPEPERRDALLDAGSSVAAGSEAALAEALSCLDRFTAAFNRCNTAAMDAELHFPHVLLAGAEPQVWSAAGQHPASLFASPKASGWTTTRYEARTPVLATADKVHFVVRYTRRRADGSVLSEHVNLWAVTRRSGRWGIAMRSY